MQRCGKDEITTSGRLSSPIPPSLPQHSLSSTDLFPLIPTLGSGLIAATPANHCAPISPRTSRASSIGPLDNPSSCSPIASPLGHLSRLLPTYTSHSQILSALPQTSQVREKALVASSHLLQCPDLLYPISTPAESYPLESTHLGVRILL